MKLQTGIALHQWPRDKTIRKIIGAPPGFLLVEHDFSGQESRWMAEYSRDETMLAVFRSQPPFDDMHSFMGAKLTDRTYEDLLTDYTASDKTTERFKVASNSRYLGKFANLSLQYRTSAKTLRQKARIDYKIPMSLAEAVNIKDTYESTLVGIPAYWQSQIELAQRQGYIESFAGKRYRFAPDAWSYRNTWSSGSTAINFPIQGVGGSQKSLAMKYLLPFLESVGGEFAFDLHDGLFSYLPGADALKNALLIKDILSNLPYKQEWGYEPTIPFPVDASIGQNWGELAEAA